VRLVAVAVWTGVLPVTDGIRALLAIGLDVQTS